MLRVALLVQLNIRFKMPIVQWNFNVCICALPSMAAGVATDARAFIPSQRAPGDERTKYLGVRRYQWGVVIHHVVLDDYRIVKANLIDGSILSFHQSRTGSCRSDRNRSTAIRVLLCHPSSKLDATDITRAVTEGQTDGMMNAIMDTQTGRILGCSLFCHEVGKVILTVQMVMQAQMPHIVLRDGVLAHPTMTEGLNMLLSKL